MSEMLQLRQQNRKLSQQGDPNLISQPIRASEFKNVHKVYVQQETIGKFGKNACKDIENRIKLIGMDELAGSSGKQPEKKAEPEPVRNDFGPVEYVNPQLDEFKRNLNYLMKDFNTAEGPTKKKGRSDSDDEREQNAASKLLDTKTD